jgi:hypothetical protein
MPKAEGAKPPDRGSAQFSHFSALVSFAPWRLRPLVPSAFGPFASRLFRPSPLRVFVNSHPLDLPGGSSALEAVRAFDASEASAVTDGSRVITDSRGLPLAPSTVMSAGSILRVVSARARPADES